MKNWCKKLTGNWQLNSAFDSVIDKYDNTRTREQENKKYEHERTNERGGGQPRRHDVEPSKYIKCIYKDDSRTMLTCVCVCVCICKCRCVCMVYECNVT